MTFKNVKNVMGSCATADDGCGGRWASWKGEGCKDFERKEGGPLPALPLSPALREAALQRPSRIETGSEALNRRALLPLSILSQHPF